MMTGMDTPLARMQKLIQKWETVDDQRSVFLRCYVMMTQNMLAANREGEFLDQLWTDLLLRRFADYYFEALILFENNHETTPSVWLQAHNCALNPDEVPLSRLMTGVNAHINYDLVLTLVELLDSEWDELSPDLRRNRYDDYCHVNQIIAETIDAVQDEVLEPDMPLMEWVDKLLGPVDELLISRLITGWRENVWNSAVQILGTTDPARRNQIIQEIENKALSLGNRIRWVV